MGEVGGPIRRQPVRGRSVDPVDGQRQHLSGTRLDHRHTRGDPVTRRQNPGHGVLRGGLGNWIERGTDRQTAFEQQPLTVRPGRAEPVVREQGAPDIGTEERNRRQLAGVYRLGRAVQLQGHCPGFAQLAVAEMAEFVHTIQDDVTADGRSLRMQHRIVGRGILHQAGQHCRLREGELTHVHVEVMFRRGLHTVGAVPEVRYVQIPFENLILVQVVLEVQRVTRFTKLALDRLFGRSLFRFPGGRGLEQDVLHVLLRKSGSTLRDRTGFLVGYIGPDQSLVIKAGVFVETRVLNVDDCLTHHHRHLVKCHDLPVLLTPQVPDHISLGIQHAGGLGQRRNGEIRRQLQERVGPALGRQTHQSRERHRHEGKQDAGQPSNDHESRGPADSCPDPRPKRPGPRRHATAGGCAAPGGAGTTGTGRRLRIPTV